MGQFEDLTGLRFGKLTVIKRAKTRNSQTYWMCQCDCGNFKEIQASWLKKCITPSCGCNTKEKMSKANTKHGLCGTRIYRCWQDIKNRCYNSKLKCYKYYGGRGISVCDEWINDVTNFYNWAIKNGYEDNLTIDRIDTDGNYEPSNCRWVTMAYQNRNMRKNKIFSYNGEKHCISEWARILKVKDSVLRYPLIRGIDFEQVVKDIKQCG